MLNLAKLRLILFFGLPATLFSLFSEVRLPANVASGGMLGNITVDSLEKAKVEINNILITGFKQTKSYIIQREIALKKGDLVSREQLAKLVTLTRQQLMNTSLFVDVEVNPVYFSDNVATIHVNVKERWYVFPVPYFKMIDRNFNSWWVEHNKSLERINYGLKFFHNNFSGRNDKLNFWLINGYTQQATLRYENPFLDKKLVHGINVGVSYSRNRELNLATVNDKQFFFKNEETFSIRQFHVDLAYTYRPAIKTRHTFRLAYTDIQLGDTVLKINPQFFDCATSRVRFPDISYNIEYYDVDYIPYPLKGFSGTARLYQRFGTKNNLTELAARGTYTKKILPGTYMQFQASGILKVPFKQPYYNKRVMGGSDLYMRGMEYFVVDGVAGGVARATFIKQVLNLNFKNPLPVKNVERIPIKLYLKAYGDAGYSYNPSPGNNTFNNKLLRTWGVGIDIITIYDIVLKLEYSYNQIGQRDLYIHSKSDF